MEALRKTLSAIFHDSFLAITDNVIIENSIDDLYKNHLLSKIAKADIVIIDGRAFQHKLEV